jgi:hypothetical protein
MIGYFSLRHRVQTGSEAHPASYPVGNRVSFLAVKRLGREANHSPPSSAGVKNAWSYTSTPPVRCAYLSKRFVSMAWYLVKDRDSFTFTCTHVPDRFLQLVPTLKCLNLGHGPYTPSWLGGLTHGKLHLYSFALLFTVISSSSSSSSSSLFL